MMQGEFSFEESDRRRAMNNTEKVLRMLERGPQVSTSLMDITHRFSTCIHNLRGRGYQIHVDKMENGLSLHTLTGFVPQVEVTDEMKLAYYSTEHWAGKRTQRMDLDGYRCCNCKSEENLQVHHWHYELFNEDLGDLMTLCESCHKRIHEYESVKTHFPHFVPQAIADKLKG